MVQLSKEPSGFNIKGINKHKTTCAILERMGGFCSRRCVKDPTA